MTEHPVEYIVIGAVVIMLIIFLYTFPTDSKWAEKRRRWSEDYNTKWFAQNVYCHKCGRAMEWVPRDTIRYEADTGRGYKSVVWTCPFPAQFSHEPNDLVEWCVKKEYV